MNRWPRYPVREICSLIVDCVNRTAPIVERVTPYRMIRTTNIRNGRIDLSTCRYVEKETYDRWTRRAKVEDGDVILTREAPIGEVGYVRNLGEVFLGQRLMQYRPDPRKVVPRYLFYAFRSPDLQHQFGSHDGSGSVVSHIRVADCLEFKVSVPPLVEQEGIAHLLGSLDDKIELNRRMNQTLEAMAQAIFRDWFVDFGPTRRKLEGATDPVTIIGGLVTDPNRAQELADLFPATLGDDGLPVGWTPRSIYDYCHVVYGAPFASKQFNPKGHGRPLARIRDLPSHVGGVFTPERHPKEHLVAPGDIVVGMDGEFRAYLWQGGPTLMNQRVCSFVPRRRENRAFLYFALKPLLASSEGSAVGTTVIHLGKKDIDRYVVLAAPPPIEAAFGELAEPLLNLLVSNGAQNRTLAATRDLLLPKLMSGEIRLGEAQKMTEAAE